MCVFHPLPLPLHRTFGKAQGHRVAADTDYTWQLIKTQWEHESDVLLMMKWGVHNPEGFALA